MKEFSESENEAREGEQDEFVQDQGLISLFYAGNSKKSLALSLGKNMIRKWNVTPYSAAL